MPTKSRKRAPARTTSTTHLPNPRQPDPLLESLNTLIYDTEPIAPPQVNFSESSEGDTICQLFPRKTLLFVRPLGSGSGHSVKDISKTNMVMCGGLPQPQKMFVRRVFARLLEDHVVTHDSRLSANSTVVFCVANKPYIERSLYDLLNGIDVRIFIEPAITFSAAFEYHWVFNPNRKFEIFLGLEGTLERSVF